LSRNRSIRSGAVLVAVAIAATLAAPSASPVVPGSTDAHAADCVWHRHTKRVVKWVRRGSKLRKVVRIKVWWTCDPVGAPAAARLGVQAFEFRFVLSRPTLPAGELVVELHNRGEDPHNLNLQRRDGPLLELPETESLGRAERRFSVQPGTYRLWCSLPLHAESGMETTLLVTPSR
jgi:hypothetical protein